MKPKSNDQYRQSSPLHPCQSGTIPIDNGQQEHKGHETDKYLRPRQKLSNIRYNQFIAENIQSTEQFHGSLFYIINKYKQNRYMMHKLYPN